MTNRVLDAIDSVRNDKLKLAQMAANPAAAHPPDCNDVALAVDMVADARNAGVITDAEAVTIIGAFDDCDYRADADLATIGGVNASLNRIAQILGG